jgi:hypothetical protein
MTAIPSYTSYALSGSDFLLVGAACFIVLVALFCFAAWTCGLVEPLQKQPAPALRAAHLDEPEDDAAFAVLSQADMNVLGQVMSTPECRAAREQFERRARRLVPLEEFNELAALADHSARYHGQEF